MAIQRYMYLTLVAIRNLATITMTAHYSRSKCIHILTEKTKFVPPNNKIQPDIIFQSVPIRLLQPPDITSFYCAVEMLLPFMAITCRKGKLYFLAGRSIKLSPVLARRQATQGDRPQDYDDDSRN